MESDNSAKDLLNQLLTATNAATRKTILAQYTKSHEIPITFFQAVKEHVFKIAFSVRHEQALLEQIINLALDYTNNLATRALGLWARSMTELFQECWSDSAATAEQALLIYDTLSDFKSYGRIGANLISTLTKLMRLSEADELARQIHARVSYAGLSPIELGITYNWMIVKGYMRDRQYAYKLMLEAYPFYISHSNRYKRAAFLTDAADIRIQSGDFIQAEKDLCLAQEFFEESPTYKTQLAITNYRLSQLFLKMGRLGEALILADKSVMLHQEQGSHSTNYTWSALLQAEILLEMGEYKWVLARLNALSHLITEDITQSKLGLALYLLLKGTTLMVAKHYEQSAAILEECCERFSTEYPHWVETAVLALAQLYVLWAKATNQSIYFEQAQKFLLMLQVKFDRENSANLAIVHLLLAQLAIMQKQVDKAQEWLQQASSLERLPHLAIFHHYLQGQLLSLAEQEFEALVHYQRAFALAQHSQQQLFMEGLQSGKFVTIEELARCMLQIFYKLEDWANVWHYTESFRTINLVSTLRRETYFSTSNEFINNKEHHHPLIDSLYSKKVHRFYLCGQLYGWLDQNEPDFSTTPLSPHEGANLRHELHALDREMEDLYELLQSRVQSLLSPYSSIHTFSQEEVTQALNEGDFLIIYNRLEDSLYATTQDSQGQQSHCKLTVSWSYIELLFGRYETGLKEFNIDLATYGQVYVQTHLKRYLVETQSLLFELYQALWTPLNIDIKDNKQNVIIVADDILHYLPFQALFTGKQYLIDLFTISYAPSASILSLCKQRAVARRGGWGQNAVLVGYAGGDNQNQLRFTANEIDKIAGYLPNVERFIDREATIINLKEKVASCYILHLATHGYMVSSSPYLSYLANLQFEK